MTEIEDENENEEIRRKKKDEGEGDSDSFGRGKAGAGSGMSAARLSSEKQQKVKSDFRHLLGNDLVEAVVEFFSEMQRASASLVVTFVERIKQTVNRNPHAIVNNAIEGGTQMAREMAQKREQQAGAARDSRGLQQRKNPGPKGMNITPGPSGPTQ